jgi:hypothetical protein
MRTRLIVAGIAVAIAMLAIPAASVSADPGAPANARGLTFGPQVVGSDQSGDYTATVDIKHVATQGNELVATAYHYAVTGPNGFSRSGDVTDGNGPALTIDPPSQCTILHLDIQPIFLNLLGLQLTTSEITLDLTAVRGPGNLLGNLLCAVAGLLDNTGSGGGITGLLNTINSRL